MFVRNTILIVFLTTAAVSLVGCKDKEKAEEPIAIFEEEIESPSDSSVIDEIWYFFNGDIQKNLQLARTTFSSKDYESMIHGIEKAEAIMKLESMRAAGQNKIDIDRSIEQMGKLANDIRNEIFVPIPEYEQTFGNAQFVLGTFHLDKAREMWKKRDYFMTGRELHEASLNFENAYLWVDHKIDSTSTKALDQSLKVASELIDDAGWVPDDVVSSFNSMNNVANKLKDKVTT